MADPLWTSGKARKARKERKLAKKVSKANYRVRYDLAFDGGGSSFDEYYRTRWGARVAAFFWVHFRSWGGSADLYNYPDK